MRVATLLSAALLLISPAFAAPIEDRAVIPRNGGVSAAMVASGSTAAPAGSGTIPGPAPAPAQPCTNSKERRSWAQFWRRQTITAAHDCSFMIASGNVYGLHG